MATLEELLKKNRVSVSQPNNFSFPITQTGNEEVVNAGENPQAKPKLLRIIKETALSQVPAYSGLGYLLKPEEFKQGNKLMATPNEQLTPEQLTTKNKELINVVLGTLSGGPNFGKPKLPISEGLSAFPESVAEINPVQKITNALKEAKPIREQQEALYTAERARRVARVAAVGKDIQGEAGFHAQLGQLKGELPKVQFESIRNKIGQPEIDQLFQTVENIPHLSPFEKVTAKTGLAKLLGAEGGRVPTRGELDLLSQVFPKEFIYEVSAKKPIMEKLWGGIESTLNLPRSIMATADLSAPLRQGAFLIGKPKQWIPAFRDMFKYAFNEKAYEGLTKDLQARPTYQLMKDSGLSITNMGENLAQREESFMSSLPEKLPIFGRIAKGSNRAYTGFLNKLRADTFDDLVKKATQSGVLKANPNAVNDIAKFVNAATGRGDLGKLQASAVVMNGLFFSPRLIASRLNLLNPMFYVKLDPFVRKEALKSLFSFAGTAGTILGLAKLGGADVGLDPRSSDFLKIKVGTSRFDVLGGFQQYMVLASRLASGQMVSSTTGKEFNLGEGYKPTTRADITQRFFEGKLSPTASFVLGMARGKDFGGGEFDVPVEITNRFIPMLASDMYDLYKESGKKGLLMGIPGTFGVGSQTYAEQIPLESKTKLGKPTIKMAQRPGLAEDIVNKVRGVEVKPVPVKEKYDEVQVLVKQGKEKEAGKIVDSLSDNDYALYKKLKERDKRVQADEEMSKIEPTYKQVKKLIKQGKEKEAKLIVDKMRDKEYAAYTRRKKLDWKELQ